MMIDLSHIGFIKISGARAKALLQGQLTCNVDEVNATQTRVGAHCNPQGRIISLFRLFQYHDDYYLQMPRKTISLAIKALEKYAVFFKVSIEDVSNTILILGYCGNLTDLHSTAPQEIDAAIEADGLYFIKCSDNPPRYEIIGIKNDLEVFREKHTLQPSNVWQQLEITSGIATIYPETSEKFLPHDIQLPQRNGVSFNKGCYTGQEIIARMHYRGKPKNKMVAMSASIDRIPILGADIYSSNGIAGSIIDYCHDDEKSYRLLVISHDIAQPLFLDSEQKHPLQRLS